MNIILTTSISAVTLSLASSRGSVWEKSLSMPHFPSSDKSYSDEDDNDDIVDDDDAVVSQDSTISIVTRL
jgi:hypothetical protein